eukprot:762975-Hanusia_phi.AAC.2
MPSALKVPLSARGGHASEDSSFSSRRQRLPLTERCHRNEYDALPSFSRKPSQITSHDSQR